MGRSKQSRFMRGRAWGPVMNFSTGALARENRTRRRRDPQRQVLAVAVGGGGRRLWRSQARGRSQGMVRFSPQSRIAGARSLHAGMESEGTGPIFFLSPPIVASRHPVSIRRAETVRDDGWSGRSILSSWTEPPACSGILLGTPLSSPPYIFLGNSLFSSDYRASTFPKYSKQMSYLQNPDYKGLSRRRTL